MGLDHDAGRLAIQWLEKALTLNPGNERVRSNLESVRVGSRRGSARPPRPPGRRRPAPLTRERVPIVAAGRGGGNGGYMAAVEFRAQGDPAQPLIIVRLAETP